MRISHPLGLAPYYEARFRVIQAVCELRRFVALRGRREAQAYRLDLVSEHGFGYYSDERREVLRYFAPLRRRQRLDGVKGCKRIAPPRLLTAAEVVL